MELIKETVCANCNSTGISDPNCICCYSNNYPTIELEFERCECCGHTNQYPADTEFNKNQFKEYEKNLSRNQ